MTWSRKLSIRSRFQKLTIFNANSDTNAHSSNAPFVIQIMRRCHWRYIFMASYALFLGRDMVLIRTSRLFAKHSAHFRFCFADPLRC